MAQLGASTMGFQVHAWRSEDKNYLDISMGGSVIQWLKLDREEMEILHREITDLLRNR